MNFWKTKIWLTFIICLLFLSAGCSFDSQGEPVETGSPSLTGERLVTEVIDGDTIIVEGGYSVRLLDIDTDERGDPCYGPAKERLEELVLDKEVRLESGQTDQDQYGRYLRYVFLDEQNICLRLVEEGLAIARIYGERGEYEDEIVRAEQQAVAEKVGCKWQAPISENGAESAEETEEEPKEISEDVWHNLTYKTTGLPIVEACQARGWLSKEVIVEGEIIDAYKYQNTSVFLDFGGAYPNQCFTALIWSDDWHKFVENPEDYYKGRTVRIKGQVTEYQSRAQIVLKDPSQIEVGK